MSRGGLRWMRMATQRHTEWAGGGADPLLPQVSRHVAALEALQVEKPLGQTFGGVAVGTATVGQRVGAAALQLLQASQLRLGVRRDICEAGVAEGKRTQCTLRTPLFTQSKSIHLYTALKSQHCVLLNEKGYGVIPRYTHVQRYAHFTCTRMCVHAYEACVAFRSVFRLSC